MTYRRSFRSAFLVLGVVAAFAGCRPAAPVAGPAPEADASPAAVVIEPEALDMGVVSIGTARSVERADQFEAAAVLALDESHTSRIGSVVDGVVVAVHAQVGDRVQPGTILGALHSHRVHDAWAAYRTAVAGARRQETEVSYAVDNEARALRLFDAKALSAQELARARVDRIAAEEALEMARTELRRSEEDLEHLGIRRDSATGGVAERIPVRTPVGGVVLERLVTQGTAVTPGAQLFVVSNLAQLWALVEVDEARLSSLAVGRDAELTVSAYPGERFPATVTFIGDTVNPSTRRVTVRCVVPNTDGRLKPQMYATVSLGAGEPRRVVIVPEDAVQEMEGRRVVFVADSNGRFVPRGVVTARRDEGSVEIEQGLRAGERVVVKGSFLLKSQALSPVGPGE